jgi:hypothetical protein
MVKNYLGQAGGLGFLGLFAGLESSVACMELGLMTIT